LLRFQIELGEKLGKQLTRLLLISGKGAFILRILGNLFMDKKLLHNEEHKEELYENHVLKYKLD
jgi:hypothetical protein